MVLAGAAVAVLLALGYLSMRLTAAPMVPLYSGLEADAAGAIVERLDRLGVAYEVRSDSAIMVPSDQVARLRMTLAGEGLPGGGPVGYELLDQGDGLGLTRFQQDIKYLRALEGELSRSIRTLNGVSNARVHLVLPKREPFARETPDPTASVLVVLRGAAALGREQVTAIQYLVAQAVPRLKPQSVSVIDQQGTLLTGTSENGENAAAVHSDDARASFEARLARSIEDMLAPHLGADKVRVNVSADIDFDRRVEREQIFDPNGQVVRSTQTSNQSESSSSGDTGSSVSVTQNLPQGAMTDTSGGKTTDSSTHKEETVNYEISSKTLGTVRESGAVRKLSVAVVVDGVTKPDANGQPVYEPRRAEELAEIDRAVKAAIGFDEKRGDKVDVVNLPFAGAALVEGDLAEPGIMDFLGRNAMTLIQWLALAVIGVVLALFVLRPIITGLFKPASRPDSSAGNATGAHSLPGVGETHMIAAPGAAGSSPVDKVGQLISSQPEEAAGIIRNWISEGAA
jgi:flagellar M-ring protein FliF